MAALKYIMALNEETARQRDGINPFRLGKQKVSTTDSRVAIAFLILRCKRHCSGVRRRKRYPTECSGPPHLLGPWGRPAWKWQGVASS
jgi:hypothetical protein